MAWNFVNIFKYTQFQIEQIVVCACAVFAFNELPFASIK